MKSPQFPIIHLLKQVKYLPVFVLVAGGLFALSYYAMAHLPGERDLMCVMGAGLTGGNIVFSAFMSVFAALIVLGIVDLVRMKAAASSIKLGSTSMIGLVAGMLTTFCTLTTIPVISLFGVGVSLSFFTDYEIYFKLGSLFLLGMSLYLVNNQLRGQCQLGCTV